MLPTVPFYSWLPVKTSSIKSCLDIYNIMELKTILPYNIWMINLLKKCYLSDCSAWNAFSFTKNEFGFFTLRINSREVKCHACHARYDQKCSSSKLFFLCQLSINTSFSKCNKSSISWHFEMFFLAMTCILYLVMSYAVDTLYRAL